MSKITERQTAVSEHPELDEVAVEIADETCRSINQRAALVPKTARSIMPYTAQYILEMAVKELQRRA